MNTSYNFGASGLNLGLLAAGLVLAYGVWVNRRDLGMRGALGVLAASLLNLLLAPLLLVEDFMNGAFAAVGSVIGLALASVVSTALAFVLLYVAANWMEAIRKAAGRAP